MDKALKATEEELEKLGKRLTKTYKRAEGELRKKWDAFFEETQKSIAGFEKDLKKAEKDGDEKEIKRLKKEIGSAKQDLTFKNKYYQEMVDTVAENISHVNEIAADYISDRVANVFAVNYNQVGMDAEDALKGYSFTMFDSKTVEYLEKEKGLKLPKPKMDIPKDMRWNKKKINAEVLQGILQGESMQKIADRFSKVIGMNEASAIRNARTYVTSAQNEGRQKSMESLANDGVKCKKYWICTHDERTRTEHSQANSDYSRDKAIPYTEPFIVGGEEIMFPADRAGSGWNVYNCRCTMGVTGFEFESVLSKEKRGSIVVDGKSGSGLQGAVQPQQKQKIITEDVRRNFRNCGGGAEFGDGFCDMLENADEVTQTIFAKYSNEIKIVDPNLKRGAYYSSGRGCHMNVGNVMVGDSCHAPYQTAAHEFGHNIDFLASGNGKYISEEFAEGVLHEAIASDFKNIVNDEFSNFAFDSIKSNVESGIAKFSDYFPKKKKYEALSNIIGNSVDYEFTKEQISDMAKVYAKEVGYTKKDKNDIMVMRIKIREDVFSDRTEFLRTMGSVSDIMESQGAGAYPFGVGHGTKYWREHKSFGHQQDAKEFFAEALDAKVANPASYEKMKKYFPNAMAVMEEIMKEWV